MCEVSEFRKYLVAVAFKCKRYRISLLQNHTGKVHNMTIGVSEDGYHVAMAEQSACLQFSIIPSDSSMLFVRELLAQVTIYLNQSQRSKLYFPTPSSNHGNSPDESVDDSLAVRQWLTLPHTERRFHI